MEKIKLLCLTYGDHSFLTQQAISKLDKSIDLTIVNGVAPHMHSFLEEAINDGVDVIVARGANTKYIREHFTIPIVDIRISLYDYVRAVHIARQIGSSIDIIVAHGDPITEVPEEFKAIGQMMNVTIRVIEYNDISELEEIVKESRADVLIGTAYTNEVAFKHQRSCVLICSGDGAVINAIYEAKYLVEESRKKRLKNELINTFVKYSNSGIIIIDGAGKIVSFNKVAETLFGVKQQSAIGQHIKEILPENTLKDALQEEFENKSVVYKLNGTKVIDNQTQIRSNHKIIGAVSVISNLSDTKKAELEYNRKNAFKNDYTGFSASATFKDIVGSSKIIRTVINEAKIFSKSDASIMILGDTGTGKELFAQSIHNHSDRANGPFVAINCSALPESLLESELFGYEDGTFTGGKRGGKEGLFEAANGGTIFLDEIGEMNSSLQAKLLRVIQEKEVMRLGGKKILNIDVRVISATNKNVYCKDNSTFRKDLLYRLNVLELKLPSLKDRENDICEIFLDMLEKKDSSVCSEISDFSSVFSVLRMYSWPGNVRELQNVCERFQLYVRSGERRDEKAVRQIIIKSIGEERLLRDVLERYHFDPSKGLEHNEAGREIISELKRTFAYSNEKLASLLGISRTTIWRIMKEQHLLT